MPHDPSGSDFAEEAAVVSWSTDSWAAHVLMETASDLLFGAEIWSARTSATKTRQLKLYSFPSFNTPVFSVETFG